jgi:hypothetical protein
MPFRHKRIPSCRNRTGKLQQNRHARLNWVGPAYRAQPEPLYRPGEDEADAAVLREVTSPRLCALWSRYGRAAHETLWTPSSHCRCRSQAPLQHRCSRQHPTRRLPPQLACRQLLRVAFTADLLVARACQWWPVKHLIPHWLTCGSETRTAGIERQSSRGHGQCSPGYDRSLAGNHQHNFHCTIVIS